MIAVRDIGRQPLTMGRLRQHVTETVGRLNAMGFRRNDRIAVVMPPGPELFVAFLSVASGFTFVPLNDHYSRDEYNRCLADLGVKALLVRAGSLSPAMDAAMSLGMQVVVLSPLMGTAAGLFSSGDEAAGPAPVPHFGQPADLAMILLTAGATAPADEKIRAVIETL